MPVQNRACYPAPVMRSLRTIARPVVLLALAAWLGVGSLHLHPTHEPVSDGHAHAGGLVHEAPADAGPSERCLARHVSVSSHGAHHEHSPTLDLRPSSCIACRLLDEHELAATRPPILFPSSDAHAPRISDRTAHESGRDPEAGPPARAPPARPHPRLA